MKTPQEVYKEVLEELGFANCYHNQMTNSDHWMCVCEAMERYAEQKLNLSGIVQAIVSDEALAIEIIARFTGNSRGTPIAKKSFIDGVLWAKGRMASVASEGQGKAAD